jgi:hypothetical protein
MSFRAMGLWRRLGVVLLVALGGASAALAQMAKPPVAALTAARIGQDQAATAPLRIINFANEQAVTTTFVQPPQLGSTAGSSGSDSNWLKVEFHYGVNPLNPKIPWVDSVQFKVWIEGRDLYNPKVPPGSTDGVAVCLIGEVTYINLQQGGDNYGVFYVHPATLARYCGSGTYEDFDRKFNVHVEAYVGGKLVDYYDKKKDVDKWWTAPIPVADLVCRQDQSPFILADPTRYPEIKLPPPEAGTSQ